MNGINTAMTSSPISNIEWWPVERLKANDYNPNIVMNQELKLLKLSLLKQLWIQPILVTKEGVIIDGFHRYMLAKTDKEVNALTMGNVPCAVLDITEPERMLLTIRINRAKGSHMAIEMSKIIKRLVQEFDYTLEDIGRGIGADKSEINLLLQDNVFKAKNMADYKYGKAWTPEQAATKR